LHDPEVVDDGWEYVCFSNHLNQKGFATWEIRPVSEVGKSNAEKSRYPKLCPHKVLPDHEISLYVDSNIIIKTDFIYRRALELENDAKNLISIPVHPTRNCLYEEAEILKYRGKDSIGAIDEQIAFLRTEGFPDEYGLYENNVIWRRHLDPKLIAMDEEWWEVYKKYSKRDQMGLAYCLWKHDISSTPFMPDHIKDHRKCEHFEFTKHRMDLFFHLKRWRAKLNYLINNGSRP